MHPGNLLLILTRGSAELLGWGGQLPPMSLSVPPTPCSLKNTVQKEAGSHRGR